MNNIDKVKAAIQDFMRDQVCLIIEPSQAFSASIQSCLNEMDLPLAQVITSRRFEDAKRIIHERRPKVVITEYEVEAKYGLSLLEVQGEYHDELSRVSIIITRNTSDSAVAEAAEEDIDAYILKPFSSGDFGQKFLEILQKKVSPSEYAKKIHLGKKLLLSKHYDEALNEFLESKKLDSRPTIACFYAGQIYLEQGHFAAALKEYRSGREYQPLHYKCLMAEFDALMARENYAEAYHLVQLIYSNYPVNAERLGQIFIAAVFTQHFDEIENYFQLFLKLEVRTAKLVQLTSLALYTAGRFFLAKVNTAKACDYFDMGVLSTSRDIGFLDKVIHELLLVNAVKEAEAFLAKILPADVGTAEYNRLSFKVGRHILPTDQVIEKGRKLVIAGQGNPEVFEYLVKTLALAGKELMAESIIARAVESHPQLRAPLYKILKENLKHL